MIAGPLFRREALTLPRSARHFILRTCYVGLFCVLLYTAGQATFGFQQVRTVGNLARFGGLIFQLFSLVQLTLVLFFSLIFTAGSIAQEKDRRTLILLLMTDLDSRELVVGKMTSSLLSTFVLFFASLPVMFATLLYGGVGPSQVFAITAVCVATAIAAGSWGALVAFWREKTFQTLAVTVLGAIAFLGVIEGIAAVTGPVGQWIGMLNPYRVLIRIVNPLASGGTLSGMLVATGVCAGGLLAMAIGLIAYTSIRLRVWNPSRSVFAGVKETDPTAEAETETTGSALPREPATTRQVTGNPVLWRETGTRAYGRRVYLIKAVYLAIAILTGWSLFGSPAGEGTVLGMLGTGGAAYVGLTLLSLILINTQAVTAITSERDGQTLELLLVTDITAKEFVLGKLYGVLYNSKEVILAPLVFIGLFLATGRLGAEPAIYLTISTLVLMGFAAMLGLHSGLNHLSSRAAIANSLGTIFFLFVGVFLLLLLLIEARSSFLIQLPSFLIFIGMGAIGLFVSLTQRNPSGALALAAASLPFLTFYAITSFLLGESLSVTLAITAAYGFTIAAMLIPAISEFEVAIGGSGRERE